MKELTQLQQNFCQLGESVERQIMRGKNSARHYVEHFSKPIYLETLVTGEDYSRMCKDLIDDTREGTKDWDEILGCIYTFLKYPTVLVFRFKGIAKI